VPSPINILGKSPKGFLNNSKYNGGTTTPLGGCYPPSNPAFYLPKAGKGKGFPTKKNIVFLTDKRRNP